MKSLGLRMKNVSEGVQVVESATGLSYPPYYIEPSLRLVTDAGHGAEGVGVLYARTLPVELNSQIQILVELTAPLVLFASKTTLKLVLAHEFLHYVELVKNFTTFNLTSEMTASTIFEELFVDSTRAVDPNLVFKNKRFARNLIKKTAGGLDDPKLNEKCRLKWIEKGMPVFKIPVGSNQVKISAGSVLSSNFDPKVIELVSAPKLGRNLARS